MTKHRSTKRKAFAFPLLLFLLLALLTWLSPVAFADVNMKDASYSRSDVDRILARDASLDVERNYNSRSLANGLFGFGWCSVLDTRLITIGGGRFKVQACGTEGPVVTTESLSDRLDFDGWLYTRITADGTVQKFDADGKLMAIRKPSGAWLELHYSRTGSLTGLRSNTGLIAKIETAPSTGKISRISVPGGAERNYRYEGDDLVATTGALGAAVYQYDELHNLIAARGAGGRRETISYDKIKDRVLALKSADGCTRSFDFTPSSERPKDLFVSRSVKKCGARVVSETKIEFQMRLGAGGTRYLDRAIWSRGGDSLEITYHPASGLPVQISRNGRLVKETI